ncbi:MAG: heme o synthase [Bacteroidota bacterium]|nr:heme o synthase [Bacteroidota bacterium]
MNNLSQNTPPEPLTKAFFKDYLMLIKFRLSSSVVGTTIIAYILGTYKLDGVSFDWGKLLALALGGMFVVASSNGFNQVYEKDTDLLMDRTQKRPVAAGRMSANDAMIFSAVIGVLGLLILAFFVNGRVAFLSLVSLFIYVLAYTPLKKVNPIAVFVGAIPGAFPPAIGWVAASGNIDFMAILLFMIQFFWQFPHFWAIAWILEDDYRKAGYTLLPSFQGRTKNNAFQTIIYSAMLLLLSMYPLTLTPSFGSLYSLFIILPCGLYLVFRAYKLYQSLSVKDAKQLMFASLIYMPSVLLSYLL